METENKQGPVVNKQGRNQDASQDERFVILIESNLLNSPKLRYYHYFTF